MISFKLTPQGSCIDASSCIVFVGEEGEVVSQGLSLEAIEKARHPQIRALLKANKFEGKRGQLYVLSIPSEGAVKQFLFVGLGKLSKKPHVDLEVLRRALGSAVLAAKKLALDNVVLAMPTPEAYGLDVAGLVKQLIVAAAMADYEFSEFKTKDAQEPKNITLLIEAPENCQAALQQALTLSEAINQARHWCDMPPNIMTPTKLSEAAKKIADEQHLTCTIFGRDKALELGMGGFCSVDAGSAQDGKFVVLEYKTKEKNAPTVAIVGKGITFDTGGISLKPSDSMHGMKFDMSGAAAVIATMKVVAQLKPEINVVGLAPLVENMPGGKASRQDDIITFMNGKTAEIKSTDAEGRLILADALCYAEKFYNPETMIDIATLTGACLYALGYFYTGLMTQDDTLQRVLPAIGNQTGDRVWPLPMDDDYKGAVISRVADLRNTGAAEYKAGTITASFFLQEFVKNARWAHLDIAGTADGVPNVSYLGSGSAGAGIRLLVEFLMNYKHYMA